MQTGFLVKRNLAHFRRTHLAVVLGVATAVAVLAGALLVGDSVRASLRDLALARLGRTDLVVTGTGFFREQLGDDLQSHGRFRQSFDAVCPLIALSGVVTRDENSARAGDVQVYGVDERFWKFHGSNGPLPEGNEALLSQGLAQELGARNGETIILRIEKPSDIPVESLHSRKDSLGMTIRLTVRHVLPVASLGEFSLRPQQGAIRTVFVPLKKLQRNLEQDGKANILLLSEKRGGGISATQAAEEILRDKFQLSDLGLKLRAIKQREAVSIESESAIIDDHSADTIRSVVKDPATATASYLTYLANTIRFNGREIPYSLVTGVDAGFDQWLKDDQSASPPPIVLNDWAAMDLGVKIGDPVTLDYYVWRDEGRLDTQEAKFQVAGITGMTGPADDRDLAPDYPGITQARSLSEWDPPFPIDLSRVRKIDEEYWDRYRTTPKAFLRLADGQKLWATRYGKLTSIRLYPQAGTAGAIDLEEVKRIYGARLRAALDPVRAGLSVQSVKEQSLQASRGATDFGEYFAYFSFFLVVSALLLATLFFKLGIEQRLREIGLLRAVGFSIGQIRSLFLREGLVLAVAGSALGLIGAIAYGALMMWGLRTWWVGAVGTTLLRLHVDWPSLLIGGIAGIVTALICIWWTLRSLRSYSPRSLLSGSPAGDSGNQAVAPSRRRLSHYSLAWLFGLPGLLLSAAAAFKLIGQVGGFFGAGVLLLIAILFFWSAWLRSDKKQTIYGNGFWPMTRLGFRNASTRPGRAVLCIALIASAAFIIVSVDAFRRDAQTPVLDKKSGTGGYPLMAESLLPIVHDLNGDQGREELNLVDEALSGAQITRLRLRPGDDTSCLNLYQPRNPRILGLSRELIESNRFAFQSSLAKTEAEKNNPWLLLNQEVIESSSNQNPQPVIPVAADANSLTYVLHLKLGDEIALNAGDGTPVRLRIVAALADSIFQGELLMAETNFIRLFPDQAGYRVFLIETEKAAIVAPFLEERLSDYGFDAVSTSEKLAGFHQVENTYLSTFQTLGGLGLLLGTLGLATVLLRNVIERRREIALMRAIGYRSPHLNLMVVAENALMLGCGLLTGVVCAMLAIAPAFVARGGRFSTVSLGLLLTAVLLTGLAASLIAVRAVSRSPLLPALRTE